MFDCDTWIKETSNNGKLLYVSFFLAFYFPHSVFSYNLEYWRLNIEAMFHSRC